MNRFVFGLILTLSASTGVAAYYGNGQTSGSAGNSVVGTARLDLTDNGTTVFGTFTKGKGDFADVLVIFIDSRAGGFSSTAGFTDRADPLRIAATGFNGSDRATATFASGFTADYAIALRPRTTVNCGELFQLVNNASLIDRGSVNLSPTGTQTSGTYTFNFKWSDIGVTSGPGVSFKFESSYISATAYRTLEGFEGVTADSIPGWDSVTFTNFDTYATAVPETTNPALAIFAGLAVTGGLVSRAWRSLARRGLQPQA
jgi:hypothetical protein